MLAESTVIFGPIDQFGWRSACSGRRRLDRLERPRAERSARGGEDDALDVFARSGAERLEDRVVLGSTGSTVAPALAARRMNSAPAQTRHSLLASATVAPRSIAASVGLRPMAPLIAAITQSAGRCAASMQRRLAGRGLDAGARQRAP